MSNSAPVAVLGGGSFGTVIANMVAEKGLEVRLWMRNAEAAQRINESHENARYVPGYRLSTRVSATSDIRSALEGVEIVFVSVPSSAVRQVMMQARPLLKPGQMLVSTTKGVEAGSFSLMSQIISELAPETRVGVLSGPNLAKEVARHELTGTVIASADEALRERIQGLLHSAYFRVYASSDIFGVELGGTLKNIYAIAAGLSAAFGMGENTRSMLLTRSLAEMSRFAVGMGANPLTFLGLAGVGDLIVTCSSALSRNYRVGYALGQGRTLSEAVEALGEVAEGVNTLRLVREKAEEMGVYMPLVSGLYEVVFNNAPVEEVIRRMMLNEQNSDVEFVLPRG